MEPDTTVRCPHCTATRSVSFEAAIRTVWPQCCDDGMVIEATTEVVEEALARMFAEARTPAGRLGHRVDWSVN